MDVAFLDWPAVAVVVGLGEVWARAWLTDRRERRDRENWHRRISEVEAMQPAVDNLRDSVRMIAEDMGQVEAKIDALHGRVGKLEHPEPDTVVTTDDFDDLAERVLALRGRIDKLEEGAGTVAP